MTMVDYEITTSKRDFDDLFERIDKRHSNGHLDLSLESCRPSLSRLDFSFGGTYPFPYLVLIALVTSFLFQSSTPFSLLINFIQLGYTFGEDPPYF
jgi:hypothetical protein